MAAKTTTKRSAVSAAMKQTAEEDREKAKARGTSGGGDTVPAKAPTTPTPPRAARGRKKAGTPPTKPKAAARANDGAKAATPKTKGKAPAQAAKPKRLSALEAAAKVLAANGGEMSAREMIEAVIAKGLWSSPAGKTPDTTLYSAIIREVGAKGSDSRFVKTGRGRFASNGKRD